MWRAGTGILLVGGLTTGCAHGTRAATPAGAGVRTAAGTSAPGRGKPVAPAAGATQDPHATADSQAVDQSLSQIEADLSTIDQAASSGEKDVPSN
jgi:hypothetical protein